LTNHFEVQDQQPIYSAIYGGAIPGFGRFHDGGTGDHDNEKAFRMKQGQAFVYGNELGWTGLAILKNQANLAFLTKLAKLRAQVRDFFDGGYLLRPPPVEGNVPDLSADWFYYWTADPITAPALQRSAWKLSDQSIAALWVNTGEQPLEVKVPTRELLRDAATWEWSELTENGQLDQKLVGENSKLPLHLNAASAKAWIFSPR
jgi:hypothetical protein